MRATAVPDARVFSGRFISYFRTIFSTPSASVICFLLAVFGKLSLLKFYFIVSNDRIYQAVAAQNWTKGLSLSINSVHASNLSKELFEPLEGYPVGYSILLVPLYSIFRDFETAALLLDLFSGIFFLIVLRDILKGLKIPVYLVNFSVVFHGFTIPVYITQATPTDLLAATLCLLNINLCIRLIQNIERSYWYALSIGVIALMTGLLRYMYIPMLFVFPLFMFLMGYYKREKKLLYAGLICFTVIMLGILFTSIGFYRAASLFVSGGTYIGNFTHIYQSERIVYAENLASFYPFAADAFSNANFILTQLSVRTGLSYRWWLTFCRIICLPFQLLFFASLIIFIWKRKGISSKPHGIFLNLGGMICIFTMAVLVYLSLTKSGDVPPPLDFHWTYIGEGRYYAFLFIALYICILLWVLFAPKNNSVRWREMAMIVFFLLTITDLLHGTIYVSKLYFKHALNNPNYAKFVQLKNVIQEQLKQETGKRDVVVASAHATAVGYSILSGGKGMFVVDELNAGEIRSDKPTILLAVFEKTRIKHFQNFLSREHIHLIKVVEDLYIYSYSVNPKNAN